MSDEKTKAGKIPAALFSFYVMCITFLTEIIAYWSSNQSIGTLFTTLAIALVGSLWLWKKDVSKKNLYCQNILNLIGAVALGTLVSIPMSKYLILFFIYIIYVAIMDTFSFTKKGENTQNAKLMNNPNSLARLSICLPIPHHGGLYPLIGVGDLSFYTLIVATSIRVWDITFLKYVIISIFLGQLLNMLIFILNWKRKWFNGIPATVFPAFFFIIAVLIKKGGF